MPKLDHVAVQVRDMDRAIAFYTEVLGLTLKFRETDEEHGESFAFLDCGGAPIELLQSLHGQQPEPTTPEKPYCPHIALASDDLDESLAVLKSHEVSLVDGPLEIDGLVRWFYFTDPDGNVLEYVQWLARVES